ncbi:uncharacterized protein LOC109834874 [Asparagus officinalis]|uniref:uncharacterized protein LOC109834874 n=1 Tax=Asparagus officinalis TaxID=4686 RepID=UPI00098E043A|nr:uncharacterized protein LOC109834874 [Asparagus officinalis]
MGKKKKNSGRQIFNIGLRASNSSLLSPAEQFQLRSDDEDESSPGIMGSTGPKGEKKKKTMADILDSCNSQCEAHLPGVQVRSLSKSLISGEGTSSRVSWADELDLDLDLEMDSPLNPNPSSVNISSAPPLNPILNSGNSTSPLLSYGIGTVPLNSKNQENVINLESDRQDENTSNISPLVLNDVPNVNPKRSCVSFFADNRKQGSGLDLNYIPPESKDVVSFNDEEWNEGVFIWQFSLVGQVMGLNVKFKAIEGFIKKVWSPLALPEINLLKSGVFLFKFKNNDDMNNILLSGPRFFGSRPMLLKPWTVGDDFEKLKDCIYPLWIQLPELKLNLWNAKGISKISSIIGRPIATDMLTTNMKRLAYARVLVEVKMPSPLPGHIAIQGHDGSQYTQKVIYELKPRWCDHCKNVGHDTKFCKRHYPLQRWVPKQKNNVAQSGISSCQTVGEVLEKQIDEIIPPIGNQLAGSNSMHPPTEKLGVENLSSNKISEEVALASVANSAVHVQPVLEMNKGKEAILTALLETKLKLSKVQAIAKKIDINWEWFSNANISDKARVMILWDPNILDVQIICFSAQHISCAVKSLDGRLNCIISSVYGYNQAEARKLLWTDLSQIQQISGNLPWLLCGDFNAMNTKDEKLGGTTLTEADTLDFNQFIDNCQLTHLKTIGCFFTWNNKQDAATRVLSRLDRALVNDQWINTYNSSQAEFLLLSFSDHSPALVTIFKDQLKLLKIALKDLNRRHFSNISEQVLRAKVDLDNVQKALSLDPLNDALICQEKDYISSFNKLLECELSFYQQKARINWNLQGDRCTNFFHSIVKNNRHKNRVMVLYNNNGERIIKGDKIVQELISYYKSLLGSSISTDPPVIDIIKNVPCLNDLQARNLTKPVTKDEIRNAIFYMPDDKAPGPDGFNASFYKSAWSIIGEETTQAIEDFFQV